MPKSTAKIEALLSENKEKIDEVKSEVQSHIDLQIKNRKVPKTSQQKDEIIEHLDNIIARLLDDVDEIAKRHEILEKLFLVKLKRVYRKPYYRRIVNDHEGHVGSGGVFDYSKEAIYPHCDSLWI